MIIGARAEGGGAVTLPSRKTKKMSVFEQKLDAIRAKINHTKFFCK